MEAKLNEKKLEKLAYNMNLAYELLSRIESGESIKGIMHGLGSGNPSVKSHVERSDQLQDELVQNYLCGDQRYKDAISTLQTEFGHIEPIQKLLEKVYQKCPALKLNAPSLHTEQTT
jgi:hypothetical protein